MVYGTYLCIILANLHCNYKLQLLGSLIKTIAIIISRCDGHVTFIKCSGLAIISRLPLLKPKFTIYKDAACPDCAGIQYKAHFDVIMFIFRIV